jgi:hypothetical protein
MQLPIVGMHFRPPAKVILAQLKGDCPLIIRPEPENPHDANALQVLVQTSSLSDHADLENMALLLPNMGFSLEDVLAQEEWHLGYIPRVNAEEIAPLFSGQTVSGKLCFDVSGKAQVRFDLPTAEPLIDDSSLDTEPRPPVYADPDN